MSEPKNFTLNEKRDYYDHIQKSLKEARDTSYFGFRNDASPETTLTKEKMREFSDQLFDDQLRLIFQDIRRVVVMQIKVNDGQTKNQAADAFLDKHVVWHAINERRVFNWDQMIALDFPEDQQMPLEAIERMLKDIAAGEYSAFPFIRRSIELKAQSAVQAPNNVIGLPRSTGPRRPSPAGDGGEGKKSPRP